MFADFIVCTYPRPKYEGNLTGHLPSSLFSVVSVLLLHLCSYAFTKVHVCAVMLSEYYVYVLVHLHKCQMTIFWLDWGKVDSSLLQLRILQSVCEADTFRDTS